VWALRGVCALSVLHALLRGPRPIQEFSPPPRPPTPLRLYVYAHTAVFLALHVALVAGVLGYTFRPEKVLRSSWNQPCAAHTLEPCACPAAPHHLHHNPNGPVSRPRARRT